MTAVSGRVPVSGRVSSTGRSATTGRVASRSRQSVLFNLPGLTLRGYWIPNDGNVKTVGATSVSGLADISGNAFHAVQSGSPSLRPTWNSTGLNGKPVITFASGQRLSIPVPVLTGTSNIAFGGVWKSTNNSAARCIMNFGSAGGFAVTIHGANTGRDEVVTKGVAFMINGPATTTMKSWIVTRDTTTTRLYLDGVEQTLSTSGSTPLAISGPSDIGAITPTGIFPWVGDFAEGWALTGLPSAAQIATIFADAQARLLT